MSPHLSHGLSYNIVRSVPCGVCEGVTSPLFAYLVGISWVVGKTDRLYAVCSCCPAESLFPVREMVKIYDICLHVYVEQCMFVGKSMNLHPPPHSKWLRDAPKHCMLPKLLTVVIRLLCNTLTDSMH